MKERPIIFNREMVQAIRDGRKTQTRRPIKTEAPVQTSPAGRPLFYDKHGRRTKPKCPFGVIGDRLWVRETLSKEKWPDYHYDVYPQVTAGTGDEDFNYRGCNYRGLVPSIHMPRWAARYILEITNVRVERVQDISDADATAEGCDNSQSVAAKNIGWYEKPVRAFQRVWQQVYGESWSRNDWVWVIDFKRIEADA